jgi:hypothetical protein
MYIDSGCRSGPGRRLVVCRRYPVLRQAGVCENRGEALRLLPRDGRQAGARRDITGAELFIQSGAAP